jgi:hypothetical protein
MTTNKVRAEQLAESWRVRVTTISRNLMDLAETEMTKTIKVRLKDSQRGYVGVTFNYASQAVKSLDSLWGSYLILARVVDEAVTLAHKNGMFFDYTDRIRELLEGQSVVLPVEHIPVSARGMLSVADKADRVTPTVMIEAMEKLFIEARDSFVKIYTAESSVRPRVAAMNQEMTKLNQWAKSLAVQLPANLLHNDLQQSLTGVERDPLGLLHEIEAIEAGLVKARSFLQGIETEHQAVMKSMAEGRAVLADLKETARLSTLAMQEAQLKILQPVDLSPTVSEDIIISLQTWLRSLEDNIKLGRYSAVKVGVAKFLKESQERLAAEKKGYARHRAGLDEREELKGRFKALHAKAKSYEARGLVLDGSLYYLAEQARHALESQPCDLVTCRQLVQEYAKALS